MTWSPDPWNFAMKVADACAERGVTPEAATREGRQAILDDEIEHCPGSEQGLTEGQCKALADWVDGSMPSARLSCWMLLMVMDPPND